MIVRFIIFLIIQFAALGIGGIFTKQGVASDWYAELIKAPWEPPGWFFGFAWTTIMICFSLLLAILWPKISNKKAFIRLVGFQWLLNVAWNPVFFYLYQVISAAVILILLLVVLWVFYLKYRKVVPDKIALIAPYILWLFVAASLNLYILFMN